MARRLGLWLRPHLRDAPPKLVGRVIEFSARPGTMRQQQADVARGIALYVLRGRAKIDYDAVWFLACELLAARDVTDVRELAPSAREPIAAS